MARPSQVSLVVLVYATGLLLGSWQEQFDAPAASLGLGLLLAASVAVHWANEAADVMTDARSHRTPFSGGSGALARSGMDPAIPHRLALLVASLTVITGLIMIAGGALPPTAGLLLGAGLAGGLAYSLPPVAAMRRGWGEWTNAALGGLLLPLYGVAVVRGTVEPRDVAAFLPFTAVVLCSVLATAWPDREADAATGKRTLQVRWPAARLRLLHHGATVAWLACTAAAVALEALPAAAAGLLVAPLMLLGTAWYTHERSPWPSVAAMVSHATITALAIMLTLA